MSAKPKFKRYPAIHCWIKHIEESNYNDNENSFHTIFGEVKRIRLLATIIEKNESLIESDDFGIQLEDDTKENIRLIFFLDDSTGMIRAYKDNVNPDNLKYFNKGDIVDVIGRLSKKEGFIALWIEIITKVEEPNYVLLRNAEIINRIKSGDIQEIKEKEVKSYETGEDNPNYIEVDEMKERVYSVIESHSNSGLGISFEKLRKEIKAPDVELRSYINDLILESRIYESDNDFFESL